jgi:cytochrome c biogenesis protein CcmG/thiol:disulfide interchange protein DsbE
LGQESDLDQDIELDASLFRLRAGVVRNVLATIAIGIVIAGLVWFFDRPGDAGGSESVTLTAAASGPAPQVGKEAPDFEVEGLDGESYRLSDFRGHPVWINFWASWCPPCRAESLDIEDVYQEKRDEGLVVLAISISEDADAVRDYVARTGMTFTVGLDEGTDVAAAYRIAGIPSHYFVDRDGVLQELHVGSMSKSTMEEKVDEILSVADEGGGA